MNSNWFKILMKATKVKYGKALVVAEKALDEITANIEKDSAAIDEIFAEAE